MLKVFCQILWGMNQNSLASATKPCSFDKVPRELILHIFSFLGGLDIRKFAQTCRKFTVILNEAPFCHAMYLDDEYFIRSKGQIIDVFIKKTSKNMSFDVKFPVYIIKRYENLIAFAGPRKIEVWDLNEKKSLYSLPTQELIFKNLLFSKGHLIFGESIPSKNKSKKDFKVHILTAIDGTKINGIKQISNLSKLRLACSYLRCHSDKEMLTLNLENQSAMRKDDLESRRRSTYGHSILAKENENGCEIDILQITDYVDKFRHTIESHSAPICLLKFIQGQERLVSVSTDGVVKYWNYTDGNYSKQPLAFIHENCFKIATCIKTNRLATISPTEINIWDLLSGEAIYTIEKPFDGNVKNKPLKVKIHDDQLIILFDKKIKILTIPQSNPTISDCTSAKRTKKNKKSRNKKTTQIEKVTQAKERKNDEFGYVSGSILADPPKNMPKNPIHSYVSL